MNGDWEKQKKKRFSIIQKCPKCGAMSLRFQEGRLMCNECGYEERVSTIK